MDPTTATWYVRNDPAPGSPSYNPFAAGLDKDARDLGLAISDADRARIYSGNIAALLNLRASA